MSYNEYTEKEIEKISKATKKKYYEYEYICIRDNPQNGCHEHILTVIAKTDKEAIRLAKKQRSNTIYGYNYFKELGPSPKKLLQFKKDYDFNISKNYWTGKLTIEVKKIW